jgi:hypothetical protein
MCMVNICKTRNRLPSIKPQRTTLSEINFNSVYQSQPLTNMNKKTNSSKSDVLFTCYMIWQNMLRCAFDHKTCFNLKSGQRITTELSSKVALTNTFKTKKFTNISSTATNTSKFNMDSNNYH